MYVTVFLRIYITISLTNSHQHIREFYITLVFYCYPSILCGVPHPTTCRKNCSWISFVVYRPLDCYVKAASLSD